MALLFKWLRSPFNYTHFFIVSIILTAILSWFVMDRTITAHEGGYRVVLIRFSWFWGLLLLNNALWLLFALISDYKQRHKARLSVNIHAFVFSHLVMTLVLASDIVHFLLFGEHWNATTISTAYYGILVGSAPLGLDYLQIITLSLLFVLLLYVSLFVVKLLPLPRLPLNRKVNAQCFFILLAGLIMLTTVQRILPSNWHSQQIQKVIPFFQFLSPDIKYPEIDKQLAQSLGDVGDIKAQQKAYLQALSENASALSFDDEAQLSIAKPNILMVHIEALRSDLMQPKHVPNMYALLSDGGQFLANHYSSSNNTVGSIFGMVSGLSGPLYQHQRATMLPLSSTQLLQKLGYRLSLFTSSPMVYQDALDVVFPQYENHEYFGEGNIIEDKRMVDDYLQEYAAKQDKPRMDYLILNSTHFPYRFPDEYAKFQPIVDDVGLSYSADHREKLETNKIGLKNRFYNSVLYADALLGELVTGLEAQQFFDNGVLVVVGDHGQEFWEHNRFGHSWSLVNEQTHVLAVIKSNIKGKNSVPIKYKYSSHSDFMPSILAAMGVPNEELQLLSGKNLWDYRPERDFVSIGIGVMGTQQPSKAAVVGQGVKVQYHYHPSLTITTISDDADVALLHRDEVLPTPLKNKVMQLTMASVNETQGKLDGTASSQQQQQEAVQP